MSRKVAALVSGGVESAVMVRELCDLFEEVFPVYVRFGLVWERVEERYLRRYLKAVKHDRLGALTCLDMPVGDIYGSHWSTSGKEVPDATSPDQAVELPGRNLFLIGKTAVWCALNGVDAIAHGTLHSNPFPDATNKFFRALEVVFAAGLRWRGQIIRPFAGLHKPEVIGRGRRLPLNLTFSCIRPERITKLAAVHCGRCNKCAERRRGFREAGVVDLTVYASAVDAHDYSRARSPANVI